MVVVGLLAILLFGSRLPKVAKSLGKSIVQFKKGLKTVQDEVDSAVDEDGDDVPDKKEGGKDDDKSGEDSGEFSG